MLKDSWDYDISHLGQESSIDNEEQLIKLRKESWKDSLKKINEFVGNEKMSQIWKEPLEKFKI